jgi:ATP-binding cassette subfamily C protein
LNSSLSLVKSALSLISSKDRNKLWKIAMLYTSLGVLDLVGVVLLGTVGTLAFKLVANDSKPTRLEVLFRSLIHLDLSTVNLALLVSVIAIAFLGAKTLLQAGISYRFVRFQARLESEIALKLYDAMLNSPVSELEKRKYSEYQYALLVGANRLVTGIFGSAISLVSDSFNIILMGAFALYASPPAFLFAGVVFAVTYFLINGPVHRRAKFYGERSAEIYPKLSEQIQENMSGIREVKIYKKESGLITRFSAARYEYSFINQKIFWLNNIVKYFLELAMLLIGVLVLGVLILTTDVRHAVTLVVIFMAIGFRLIPNIQRIQNSIVSLRISEGATASLFTMISELSLNSDILHRSSTNITEFASIDASNVSFRYPADNEKEILLDINFNLKRNETMLILGESGSGKSTLLDLISGLNFPTYGAIDFKDSENITIASAPTMAYVSQTSVLFGENVYENIAFGSSSDTVDTNSIDVILAELNLSYLVFSEAFKKVRTDGTNLSGGERQRLAIARAKYSDAQIVFFDEPTSSLDDENKERVIKYINSIRGKKTIFIVSHEKNLLSYCDSVLLISKGKQMFFGDVRDFLKQSNVQND